MKADDYLVQVAYVTGRILHEGTGQPPVGEIEFTADEGKIFGRVFDDGRFVISAYEQFPLLNLNIRVRSPQYRAGEVTHSLTVTIPAGDYDPEPPTAPAALFDVGDIILPGEGVNVRGRVTEAADPEVPVAGADVTLTHNGPPGSEIPSETTDADGRYRFKDARLWSPAEIAVSKTGFVTETRALRPDYGKLVNEEHFRLQPSP